MGTWSTLSIAGHPCEAFEPATPSAHGFAVLYLHCVGQGRLADHSRFGELFDRHSLRCLAPLTGESWWTDRIHPPFDREVSAERHVMERVLPWLSENWDVRPTRIALLGISMGGQGALKLAYKFPRIFPTVAAISPAIDYQRRLAEGDPALRAMYRDAEQARQDTATLHIHPLNWPRHQWFACDPTDDEWYEGVDRLRMKLNSIGVPFAGDLETIAGGHSWEYYERMAEPALKYIAENLEMERLRV